MIPKSLYKKIQKVLPIPCVDIVIKNDEDEFLMLKRKNRPVKNKWWFVGGRIEKGEILEEAALRKVKEETELDVSLKKILGVDQTFFKKGFFGQSVQTVNIVFLAKTKGKPKIKLDNQSSGYKWFNKINPNWHTYLKKFLKLSGFK